MVRLPSLSNKGERVVRALVLYDEEPEPDRYAQHADLCRHVPGATFRHGRVFGSPAGEPAYRYVAEWEFPTRDAFKEAARTPEFAATGKDAMEMGGRFTVLFAELD
jgi:EthD domain